MGTSASASQLAAKVNKAATVVPRAQRAANIQTARAVKAQWLTGAGLQQGSTIAGRRIGVRDSTVGTAKVTTLIAWTGPVHLVEGPTTRHIIAARHLGTRTGIRRKTHRLSVGAGLNEAFGGTGANRGVFGPMITTTKGRRGVRARAGKKALTVGGNLRAYAFHPGTKGRGFWPKNKSDAHRIATTVYKQAALPSILREAGLA